MGRRAKGPRLWLHPERRDSEGRLTHAATWVIIDRSNQLRTGYKSEERSLAEAKLHLYSIGQWPCDRADVDRARIRYVYFVTCDIPDFPVKIGSAFDVEIRMRALQGAMPWPLQTLLIIEGDERKERELHEVFADLRMKGEWFARHPSLLEYIKSAEMVLMPSHREEMAS